MKLNYEQAAELLYETMKAIEQISDTREKPVTVDAMILINSRAKQAIRQAKIEIAKGSE